MILNNAFQTVNCLQDAINYRTQAENNLKKLQTKIQNNEQTKTTTQR